MKLSFACMLALILGVSACSASTAQLHYVGISVGGRTYIAKVLPQIMRPWNINAIDKNAADASYPGPVLWYIRTIGSNVFDADGFYDVSPRKDTIEFINRMQSQLGALRWFSVRRCQETDYWGLLGVSKDAQCTMDAKFSKASGIILIEVVNKNNVTWKIKQLHIDSHVLARHGRNQKRSCRVSGT